MNTTYSIDRMANGAFLRRISTHTATLFTLLLCFSYQADAKELYVDINGGDDTISYSQNSAAAPWASIGRAVWGSITRANPNAAEAARAGDTVIVRAGTYATSQSTGYRFDPIYNPINSGTAGNEIVIRADGHVTLQSFNSGAGEPIIGALDRSYIVWDGFYIDEINVNTRADTGPVVIWNSSRVTIQNFNVRGKTVDWQDNHNLIRIELSENCLIRNNRLHDNRGAANVMNGSAILLYDSGDITIEHNEIYDSEGGIFMKMAHQGVIMHNIIIRYNHLYNLDVGITNLEVNDSLGQFGARIYQNILDDTGDGILFVGTNSNGPANIDVVNNIVVNSGAGIYLRPGAEGYRDLVFRNNIFVGNGTGVFASYIANSDIADTNFSHNIYFSNNIHASVQSTRYTLADWQSTFAQDQTGSSQTDPMFINPANGDYHISMNSPARGAGIDVLNLLGQGTNTSIHIGAYVVGDEVIGLVDSLGQPPKTPRPPTLE